MKVTIERALPHCEVDRFYDIYAAAFAPLQSKAAARHVLEADEFATELADERIDKYLAWNAGGTAVGLTTIATDLAALSWIEPYYYTNHYPDHAARGALLYFGYTVADPIADKPGTFRSMMRAICERCAEQGAALAFDTWAYHNLYGAGVTQTGYVADFGEVEPFTRARRRQLVFGLSEQPG